MFQGKKRFQPSFYSRKILVSLQLINQHHQQKKIMFYDICLFTKPETHQSSEIHRLVSTEDEWPSIDEFLNDSALLENYNISEPEITICAPQNSPSPTQKDHPPKSKKKSLRESTKNSLFHNFQKHLITLIKKMVLIKEQSFEEFENSKLPYLLWAAFLKTKTHSKKIFHIIFGVPSQKTPKKQVQKLAKSFEEFRKIADQYSTDEIGEAQSLLRCWVVQRIQLSDKKQIQKNCHVHKIQEFFEYVKSFTLELREGPATERMTKVRKSSVLQKLQSQLQ